MCKLYVHLNYNKKILYLFLLCVRMSGKNVNYGYKKI